MKLHYSEKKMQQKEFLSMEKKLGVNISKIRILEEFKS